MLDWRNWIINPQVYKPIYSPRYITKSSNSNTETYLGQLSARLGIPVVLSEAYACVLIDIVSVDLHW